MENIKEKIDKYINNINLLKTPAHFIKELFNDLSNKINLNENNIVNINNTINNIQRDVKTKEEFHSNKLDLTENKYYVNYSILDKFQIGDISYNSTFPTIDIIGNNLSLLLPKSIKLKNELIDFSGINKYILNVLNGTCSIEKYPFGLGTKHSNLELKFTDLYSPKSPYLPLYKLETGEIIELESDLTEGTYIYLNDDITTINSEEFSSCDNLVSIKIPYGVTSIGEYAFEYCDNLTSITIPESVTSIGENAFYDCYDFNSIYINDLKAWCNILLGDSSLILSLYTPFSERTDDDDINNIYLNEEPIIDLIIPENVVKINSGVFGYCNQIKTLTIPKSLKSIGLAAFEGCTSLREIHIPDLQTWCNIKTSNEVNTYLNLLASADLSNENSAIYLMILIMLLSWNPLMLNVSSGQPVSLMLNNKEVVNLNIPNNITSITHGGFMGSRLQTITGGDDIKNIGIGAFLYNDFLHKVILPKNLTNIDTLAFAYCSSLTDIIIPDNVRTIGTYAFGECINLSSVTLGKNLNSIKTGAFAGCESLNSIYIPKNVLNISENVFKGCTSLSNIVVDENNSQYSSYNNILYNKDKTELLLCGSEVSELSLNGITSIKNNAFDTVNKIDSVYVDSIEELLNINYNIWGQTSDGISLYYGSPFHKTDKLYINNELITNVVIPEGVTTVNNTGFRDYKRLESISIPKSMTDISPNLGGCFCGCPNLHTVIWNAQNHTDFYSNHTLIFDSYYNRNDYGYNTNNSITSFIFGDNVEHIPAYLCLGMSGLSSITIPNSVASIGNYAFSYCTSLTSIEIPNSVTYIGGDAFAYCSGLTSVTISSIVPPSLGYDAFYKTHSNLVIYVPDESVNAYKTASNWKSYVSKIKPLSEKPE